MPFHRLEVEGVVVHRYQAADGAFLRCRDEDVVFHYLVEGEVSPVQDEDVAFRVPLRHLYLRVIWDVAAVLSGV